MSQDIDFISNQIYITLDVWQDLLWVIDEINFHSHWFTQDNLMQAKLATCRQLHPHINNMGLSHWPGGSSGTILYSQLKLGEDCLCYLIYQLINQRFITSQVITI